MHVRAATLVSAVLLSLALPAASSPAGAAADTVFQCSTRDGRTVFSDEPCVGAPRVRVWSPKSPAAGIERSRAPATVASQSVVNRSSRYDPFVDCQRRGGRYELAARICRLPADAAKQMFDAN